MRNFYAKIGQEINSYLGFLSIRKKRDYEPEQIPGIEGIVK